MRARPFVCIVNVFMQFRSSGDSWFLHSQWCCCPAAVEHSGDIPSFVHKVIEREREREREEPKLEMWSSLGRRGSTGRLMQSKADMPTQ